MIKNYSFKHSVLAVVSLSSMLSVFAHAGLNQLKNKDLVELVKDEQSWSSNSRIMRSRVRSEANSKSLEKEIEKNYKKFIKKHLSKTKKKKKAKISDDQYLVHLQEASLWRKPDVSFTKSLMQGKDPSGTFVNPDEIHCHWVPKKTNGKTKKFFCVEENSKSVIKVKYGTDENFTEPVMSKILWGLGFGGDINLWAKKVVCHGCPSPHPKKTSMNCIAAKLNGQLSLPKEQKRFYEAEKDCAFYKSPYYVFENATVEVRISNEEMESKNREGFTGDDLNLIVGLQNFTQEEKRLFSTKAFIDHFSERVNEKTDLNEFADHFNEAEKIYLRYKAYSTLYKNNKKALSYFSRNEKKMLLDYLNEISEKKVDFYKRRQLYVDGFIILNALFNNPDQKAENNGLSCLIGTDRSCQNLHAFVADFGYSLGGGFGIQSALVGNAKFDAYRWSEKLNLKEKNGRCYNDLTPFPDMHHALYKEEISQEGLNFFIDLYDEFIKKPGYEAVLFDPHINGVKTANRFVDVLRSKMKAIKKLKCRYFFKNKNDTLLEIAKVRKKAVNKLRQNKEGPFIHLFGKKLRSDYLIP